MAIWVLLKQHIGEEGARGVDAASGVAHLYTPIKKVRMEEDGIIAIVAITSVFAVALACACCSYFERYSAVEEDEEDYEITA
jgi:hypothetical protein